MDGNKNGKIDVDEFMNYLYNPDIKNKDKTLLDSVFYIRK